PGAAGLGRARHPAEQVQLPAGGDAGAPRLVVARLARRARRLVGAAAHVGGLAVGGDRGQGVEARAAQQRVGAVEPGQRDAQVVVGLQRLVDQARQQRIIQALQEGIVEGGWRGGARGGGRVRFEASGYRHVRADVVRAGHAGREQRGGERSDGQWLHHGSVSPWWKKPPFGPSGPTSASCTLVRAPSATSSSAPGFMSVLTLPGWIALTLIAVSRSS